ncbi:MAG: hypothetical protein JSU86_19110 [Phycisphaerales bacterium]|nr:MAG: hypothetical protein JSU86_19110 [Phycisphaerales bacterium]
MDHSSQWSLRVIDLLCGCVLGVCLLGFVWLTVVREDGTKTEIGELKRFIREAREDHRVLQAASQKQRVLLTKRRGELAQTGELPAEMPVERYFQTLSSMASDHLLRVVRHNPLPSRRYPGLLEQRYAYEVRGSFPALTGFLKSIEEADFWADVSYLKVDRGGGPEAVAPSERVAVLTLSLFSAPESDGPDDGGDGT